MMNQILQKIMKNKDFVDELKKIQGINHSEFDLIIDNYVISCKKDLEAVGVSSKKIEDNDSLIHTAILTYVLSFLDVDRSEMYLNSYNLQKDILRHLEDYTKDGI